MGEEKNYSVLGTDTPRGGGEERVTGAGIYGFDLQLPGALHGLVLRSAHAHARLTRVDTTAAAALPGVRAVVTAADVSDLLYGRTLDDRPLFARDVVRYHGDPIAAVAADSVALARAALAAIVVEYEPLPVLIDLETALTADAPVLHPEIPPPATLPGDAGLNNVCGHALVEFGDVTQALADADVVVEEEFTTATVHPQYLEPRIAAAQLESDGRLTVWVNAQAPFSIRTEVARLLDLAMNDVRIKVTEIGGGFGGKGCGITSSAGLEPICGLLAIRSGRPVSMVMDKAEETVTTTVRAATRIRLKTGVMKDGTIVGREARVLYDAGAYSGFAQNANAQCTMLVGGWYRLPSARLEGFAVYTNKQVCGPVRGPGGPQAAFALESHMDSLAEAVGMDPVAFRLKNVPAPGEGIPCAAKLKDVSLGETLAIAAERIGWGKVALGPHQGIGFACGSWPDKRGPGGGAMVKLNEDGSVTLHVGKVDYGTAIRFGIPMIVAEELGVDFADVTVVNVDTDASPWDAGTVGSRSLLVSGHAARLAAIDAREQLFALAAERLGVSAGDLEMVAKTFRVVTDPEKSLPLAKVCAGAHNAIGEVIGRGYFDAQAAHDAARESGTSQPFATHAALVEVDPDTGTVKVLRYVAVHDVGYVLHRSAAEGQIEGGVVMSLGQALCEQVVIDDEGRTRNPSFVDYLLPTLNMLPDIETVLVDGYPGSGPYGTKGAGEIGSVPPIAAIANAIHHATGVRIRDLPMNPERVLKALRDARG